MPAPISTPEQLAALAHADGGWGYVAGQPAHLEPTCLALLALKPFADRCGPAVGQARAFLHRCRCADGSYRLGRGREAAVWGTAMALFVETVYRQSQQPSADERATAAVLLGVKGRVLKADPEVADMADINFEIVGWPWATDNFAWVEPTSWACVALRAAGQGGHPRVREGERLLLDRAFETGGVNYGNRTVLGKKTAPIPGPTALMLVALHGQRDEPRVRAGLRYLCDELATSNDLEHLGLGKVALELYRDDPAVAAVLPNIDERIAAAYAKRREVKWLATSPLREALVLLANHTDANPFRVTTPNAAPLDATTPIVVKPPLVERVKSKFRNVVVRGLEGLRQLPVRSAVHIARVPDYDGDLLGTLRMQFAAFRDEVPLAGKRVVLKPNLVEFHRDKVVNTDPRFVDAVIALCKAEGAGEIIVAEGPGHWRNLEFLAAESGLGDVLTKHGVRLVDINHDEPVKTLNLGRLTGLEYLYLSRTVASADVLISLPKMKTHHWAGCTLALKNLFGVLPGICYGWPKNELHWRGIPQSIIDIALTQTPQLAIVDAVVGMEGDGPLNGTAKHVGAILMGTDLVAVDATGARMMGLPADRIPYLAMGAAMKLGRVKEAEIEQIGESIAALATDFEKPPYFERALMPAG